MCLLLTTDLKTKFETYKDQIDYIWELDNPAHGYYLYEATIGYRDAVVLHTFDMTEEVLESVIIQSVVDKIKKAMNDSGFGSDSE